MRLARPSTQSCSMGGSRFSDNLCWIKPQDARNSWISGYPRGHALSLRPLQLILGQVTMRWSGVTIFAWRTQLTTIARLLIIEEETHLSKPKNMIIWLVLFPRSTRWRVDVATHNNNNRFKCRRKRRLLKKAETIKEGIKGSDIAKGKQRYTKEYRVRFALTSPPHSRTKAV